MGRNERGGSVQWARGEAGKSWGRGLRDERAEGSIGKKEKAQRDRSYVRER